MKWTMMGSVTGILLAAAVLAAEIHAMDMPEMPPPQAEHAWLQKLVGEWTSEAKFYMAPDQPPMESEGTETVRALGGFWVVSDMTGSMPGLDEPMKGMLTLGYDIAKEKYVGAWVDSMGSHIWLYEGTLDAEKNVLTLYTEGPCPMAEGAITQFREVVEFTSDDERSFTSYMRNEDGGWTKIVEITFRRKS